MPYNLVVLASSFILAAIFAVFGAFSLSQSTVRLDLQLESEAVRLRNIFEISQFELEHQAQALAQGLAADPEIARLLDEGAQAVAVDGSDGVRASLARELLASRLHAQWRDMHGAYDMQQMQFLVAPGITSFLRLHAPREFGDRLDEIRPLLVDARDRLAARSGFEIGRVYAGVRGVVPVVHTLADGSTRRAGLLEVGLGMDAQLRRLSDKLDIGIAVLLRPEWVSGAMWQDFRPDIADPGQQRCCYLLSASRPQAAEWINASLFAIDQPGLATGLMTWGDTTYQTVRFDLRDYLGRQDVSRPPVGSILIWRDAGPLLSRHREGRSDTIRNTLGTYAVVQLLMLMLLRLSRREWQRQLDIQTAATERLSRRNELLLETAGEGIYGVGADGRASFINRSALRMLGLRAEDVVGHRQHALFHHHHPDGNPYPEERCPVVRTLSDGTPRACEDWFFRSDGSSFPVAMTIAPIHEDGEIAGAVVVFRDISELRAKQEELLRLASTDPLTGTHNRRRFLELLDAELARVRRHGGTAALLMTDLDHFKRVNDEHGHAVGDIVLRHYADTVSRTLRKIDAVGRLGGEEFAILMPGETVDGARELAERLRSRLSHSAARTDECEIPITTSIGITLLRPGDDGADTALQRADQALYAAKAAGRDRVEVKI